MSGGIPQRPLETLMAWKGTTFHFMLYFTLNTTRERCMPKTESTFVLQTLMHCSNVILTYIQKMHYLTAVKSEEKRLLYIYIHTAHTYTFTTQLRHRQCLLLLLEPIRPTITVHGGGDTSHQHRLPGNERITTWRGSRILLRWDVYLNREDCCTTGQTSCYTV